MYTFLQRLQNRKRQTDRRVEGTLEHDVCNLREGGAEWEGMRLRPFLWCDGGGGHREKCVWW